MNVTISVYSFQKMLQMMKKATHNKQSTKITTFYEVRIANLMGMDIRLY